MNSKFVKVRCKKCKNEQVIFENSSSKINCLVCEEVIATPSGGKCNINTKVLEVIE